MSDTRESMGAVSPPEKPTVELEKPPAWAISMSEKIARGFADTNARLSGIETTVDTLVEDGKAANQRMTRIEVRMDTFEERQNSASVRVKGESEVNLKQDALLSQVITRVDGVEKKVDELTTKADDLTVKTDAQTVMLTEAKTAASKLWADPRAKAVASAIWLAFVYWLGTKGIKVLP